MSADQLTWISGVLLGFGLGMIVSVYRWSRLFNQMNQRWSALCSEMSRDYGNIIEGYRAAHESYRDLLAKDQKER